MAEELNEPEEKLEDLIAARRRELCKAVQPLVEEYQITPELFFIWRTPRFGTINPTDLTNPVWHFMIKTKLWADAYLQYFVPDDDILKSKLEEESPTWTFDRMGMSETTLDDGRIIYIAGEHEDWYDENFQIYNDVIIEQPDGTLTILGYPKEVFPPTDFHSATLVNNQIIIIGSLSYPEDRLLNTTKVFVLSLDDFSIRQVFPTGECPNWIFDHEAILSYDKKSVAISKGRVNGDEISSLLPNLDEWELDIERWEWRRVLKSHWKRWHVLRSDRNPFRLSHDQYKEDEDRKIWSSLYIPPAHIQPIFWELRIFPKKLHINGSRVIYKENYSSILVTVEGELPEEITTVLLEDLVQKLTLLEKTPYEIVPVIET